MENFYIVANNKFSFDYIQTKLIQMGYRYSLDYAPYVKDDGTINICWGSAKFAIIIEGKFIIGIAGARSPKLKGLKEVSIEDFVLVET